MILRDIKRILGTFLILATSFFTSSAPVSALQLSELEPKISADAKVEFNEAESPYDFDVTLLDKNQTVEYDATITNDSTYDIEINSVEINNSNYDFLEYSFDGVASSDVINTNDTKTIKIFVKSNDANTRTVNEDLNLQIHFKELDSSTPSEDEPDNPNTYAGKAILSVIAIATGITLFIIFKKSSRIRIGILVFILPVVGLVLFSNEASAESDLVFSILGKVRFVNSYNVTINPNGGVYNNHTEAYTETVRDGYVVRLSNPSRDTFEFREWTADVGEIINNTITITQDTVITAQWDEIYHTVSVDPNGGTYGGQSTITEVSVRDGDTFHIGNDPVRGSYTFLGWNITPNDLDPNDDIVVTQDINFKAIWNENYYNVTIDPNGGEYLGHTASYTEQYRENAEITMQDATRDTYRFVGWQMSVGELDSNNKFSVTSDVTLTAQWEEIYYDVTIDPNGGVYDTHTSSFTTSYRAGTELTIGNATRDTYRFTGWTADPNILGQDNKLIVTSNVTITANWEGIYYNLTINPNGGTYGTHTSSFTESYRAGSVISISSPERPTYTFSGWSVQGSPIESGSITLNSDTIITAQWGENKYSLTIRPNGGTYGEHTEEFTEDYHEGETINLLRPTRNTYDFTGWDTDGDSVVNDQITLTQNTIITAQWSEIYYSLTIDPNGGTYGDHTSSFSEDYRANSYAELLTPTKTGCDFAYWKLEDNTEYTGDSIQMTRNIVLVAQYDDQYFNLTVDPNGGKFNGETTVFHDRVKYGTVVDLTNTEYADHEIRDWTKDGTETLPADTSEITITADTDLVINWWSSIFYTITINPNEGVYNNSSEIQEFQARKGEPFTVGEATRERYALSQWTFEDDSVLSTNPFIVDGDHTLTAHWFLAVAKNKRTNKLYSSIMAAHDEANPGDITGDTIILLIDTAEVVTNEKDITLDLGEHTITGYITNTASGNLTLINGEINNYDSPVESQDNPNHAAVINNGTLTMGIDDYNSTGAVNIQRNYIRLIGTEIGLLQNSVFYFYDGFIEGDVGLDGGYDGSPFYHNTFDGTTIYYFPLVTHNDLKDCQHVELQNADRAVSKTTERGDIYYYNLQDNVNTSTLTGYQIYAVRNFDASYPITVTENADITFDLDGYVVSAGDDWTINGKLTITDGKASTGTGSLRTSRPITNNNELEFINAKASTLSANTLIENHKNLSLTNSTLSSEFGYTLEVSGDNTKLTMDDTSFIRTDTKDIYVVHNTSTDFVIDGGNIAGFSKAVRNKSGAQLTLKSGNISTENILNDATGLITIDNYGKLIIEGGKVSSVATNPSRSNTKAIYNNGQGLTLTGGEIYCYSANSYSECIDYSSSSTISGGSIKVVANGSAYGLGNRGSDTKILGGTISVTSESGTAYAVTNSNSGKVTISGGNITSATNSAHDSMAIRHFNGSFIINGNATINAESDGGGVATGIYTESNGVVITGGNISGDTYGLQSRYDSTKTTIGDNDMDEDEKSIIMSTPVIRGGQYGIYSGDVSFYDGVLYGGINAATENAIRQIPHDAARKTAVVDDTEKSWLEHNSNYLLVDGVPYNSFTLAYEAAKNSSSETKLITVIEDHSSTSALPTIEAGQDITLNLNGFTLQYTQSLINKGNLTITDKDNTNTGTFENINITSTPAITNNGTLTQNGGTIKSRYVAIRNEIASGGNAPTLYLNAGNLIVNNLIDTSSSTAMAVYCYNSGISVNLAENYNISVTTKLATPHAISGCSNLIVNGSTINVSTESNGSRPSAIYEGSMTFNSGVINVEGTGTIYGIYGTASTINGGTITATSTGGEAAGIHGSYYKTTIHGGTITGHTANNTNAYGIIFYNGTGNRGELEMTGGTIIATSESGTAIGAYLGKALITGGSITGDTYGIDGDSDRNRITLGVDDGTISNGANASPRIESHGNYAIHEGYVIFYDGVLVGENPYTTDTIKAIPDGAVFHNEVISDINHCWLEYGEPYLRIEGKDSYRSLTAAYEDADDGDVIEVIADYTTQADLPTNPAGRTITIDLHGHHLAYYQSLTNAGTMIITNLDPLHEGILENVNPTKTATVTNNSNAKLEVRGGTITSSQLTIQNNGTLEIYDGEISCSSTTSYEINTINNQGTIKIPTTAQDPVIKATKTNSNNTAIAIRGGTAEINKGTIEVESIYMAKAFYYTRATINGGTINVHATRNSAYGINNTTESVTINGGTINASSDSGVAYGVAISTGKVTMTDGVITANGAGGTYGVYTSSSYSSMGTVEMSGGSVDAVSSDSVAYGVTAGKGNITGGTIHSNTYGLYVGYSGNVVTIGDNTDDTLSITSPEIIGDVYAVYDGSINFYDGVLKGVLGTNSGAYFDNNIKQVADGTTVYVDTETINGEEYEVKYLVAAHPVAIINETTQYYSLYDAVEDSIPGDVIRLLEDNYVFNKIVVDDNQDVTIDLDGHNIISGNQIANNGKLAFINNDHSTPAAISFREPNAFFNNKQVKNSAVQPELTLENVVIHAYIVIDNGANTTATIKNSKLYADYDSGTYGIKGNGTVNITDNSYIYAKQYAVSLSESNLTIENSIVEKLNSSAYSTISLSSSGLIVDNSEIKGEYDRALSISYDSSTSTIENNSKIYGRIIANGSLDILNSTVSQTTNYTSGSLVSSSSTNNVLTISDSTFNSTYLSNSTSCYSGTFTSSTGRSVIYSKGTLTANRIQIHHSYGASNPCDMNYIKNAGTATIDGLTIDNNDSVTINRTSAGIVNEGQMVLKNANINLDRYESYGIYTLGGELTLLDSTVNITGATSYGLYINDGDLTMGIPEPVDSPNYGTENADVSTTNPAITAIGATSGIGVYKNLGRFKYYDGVITGSTSAIPRDKITTDVEHLYEPTFHTDANGNDVCILTWMRELPSQPGD